ncbi:MAG: HAD family hydrolase [Candidatus Woesearchaeota archaeon]
MSMLITAIIVATAFLALYWVFWGQRKHNEMFMPKRKTELKAVLFDLDGVILDSFERQYVVFNDLRKKFGLNHIDKHEYKKKFWGNSLESSAKHYFEKHDLKELHIAYNNLVKTHMGKSKLISHAEEVLKIIKNKNLKIGLVTNTTTERTTNDLRFHKINKYFDAIVTADDVEKPKPYPDGTLKLCKKLNVMPDETILVGDSKNDYKAGKSAGCFVVGFNTHGDLIISKLSDLLELV